MGLFNINLIGAFIFSLVLIAILSKRPSLHKFELELWKIPFVAHIIICLTAVVFFFVYAFKLSDYWVFSIVNNTLIDGALLWIHEAGHIYWSWGGRFMTILGGTLNEIVFTLGPAAYCFFRDYKLTFCMFLYFFAFSLIGISRYAGDAQARQLPLLGGDSSGHDWYNMLEMIGLLKYDQIVSWGIYSFGILTLLMGSGYFFIQIHRFAKR